MYEENDVSSKGFSSEGRKKGAMDDCLLFDIWFYSKMFE